MAKLDSVPLYPVSLAAGGFPTNLVLNKTPDGKFQVANVLKPGGPQEGDFEVLYTGDDEQSAREFALKGFYVPSVYWGVSPFGCTREPRYALL